MKIDWHIILDQTALLPILILLWINCKKQKREVYIPFFALVVIKETAEIATFILIKLFHQSNAIPYNILYTAEAFLLLYQFYKWNTFSDRIEIFYLCLLILSTVWLLDYFVINSFTLFNLYFRFTYSLLLTLIAIYQINKITVNSNSEIYKNPKAIICAGIILLFTYNIIYEVIFRMGLYDASYSKFAIKVDFIMAYVNALTNLLFAWAIYNMEYLKNYTIPENNKYAN